MNAGSMDDTKISEWVPILDGPTLSANGTMSNSGGAAPSGGLNGWVPAGFPPAGFPPAGIPLAGFPTGSIATVVGGVQTDTTETTTQPVGQVRHGGPFLQNAWQWAIVSIAAIIAVMAAAEVGLGRLIDQFEIGTPQRLGAICASLFSNDVVIIGVLIVVLRRMGMSFRSLGLRRPADVKESIVLGFAAWFVFVLIAGIWTLVSQSPAERQANNPFVKERTVTSRELSPRDGPNGSGAESGGPLTPAREAPGKAPGERPEQTEARSGADGAKPKAETQDNRHVLIKVLSDNPPKALLISILITGCIGAPLLEELLVRGFLFGAFSQRFGKLAGGAVSSLLFGFAHIFAYPLKMIPPLVVMGMALAWLAWQTGSIVPGIFIHAFVNSLGLGIAASLGANILTLIIGSWLALGLILFPWIRSKATLGLSSAG